MAMNAAECESMINVARKSGAILAVGHVMRYFDGIRILKRFGMEERLGRLCAITLNRNCDYFTNHPAWFLEKSKSGGGILMNYGAHSLDVLLYTTGLSIERVVSVGNNFLTNHDVEATAQLLLTLTGGIGASVLHCGCKVPDEWNGTYYFTNGTAQIRRDGQELWVSEGGQPYTQAEVGKEKMHENFMIDQINEFVKMLKGEENEMATAEYSRSIIAALDEAFAQI